MFNAVLNTLCTMYQIRFGEFHAHPDARWLTEQLVDEAYGAAEAAGYELLGTRETEVETILHTAGVAHPLHYPSMYQDLTKGRPTEVDYINGYIAKVGRENGYVCKLHEFLTREVHLAERAFAIHNPDIVAQASDRISNHISSFFLTHIRERKPMTINILKKANDVKRVFAAVLAVTTLVSVAACGSDSTSASLDSNSGKTTKITVGVCPGPYGDMVEKVIGPLLKDDGFELKTKLFNDYVQPDKALASGSIQANLMQHINYLNKFTKDNNLDLTSLGQVPTLGLGIYSKKYQSIDDIEDGSTVSIAADGSNLARSLGVLEQQGLVTLKGDIDSTKASVNDIASNPKNLKIKTLDAAQLARSVDTVDVALVPGNFAWAAGLKPAEALATEQQDEGVINVFVVNTKDVDSDFGKAVKKLLTSQEFKDAIAKSDFKDFGKPTTW